MGNCPPALMEDWDRSHHFPHLTRPSCDFIDDEVTDKISIRVLTVVRPTNAQRSTRQVSMLKSERDGSECG